MLEVYGGGGINPPHIYMISSNGDDICVALGNGHVCMFECINSLEGTRSWEAHEERVMCCGWEKSQNLIYTASRDNIALWNQNLVKRVALELKVIFI